MIAVQNTASEEPIKLLRPLIPQYGHIGSVSNPNVVIISDHADNIVRLKKLIREIDVADDDEVIMIPLKEAWVGSVIAILERIAPDQVGAAAKGPSRVQVIANERNNSLVLRGKPQPISKIVKVVDKLDQPATTADSTQVIKLSHADAENVSKILSSVVVKNNSGEKASQQPITIAADLPERISGQSRSWDNERDYFADRKTRHPTRSGNDRGCHRGGYDRRFELARCRACSR